MQTQGRYRWFVVIICFLFMLLHQSDRLLIGPLTTPIMESFDINEAQMGAVFTGALLVGAALYPLWGYLYDRYARPRLLAVASGVWGATTWLGAVAPTYPTFLLSRASTGIDDSSYPGIYSLISDYFGPAGRGKIYGFLQLSAPLGYMLGTILALSLRETIGWRGVFYLTGSLGVVLAVVIWFTLRDTPRGRSEPELADLPEISRYRFDWQAARNLLRKRTLIFLYIQGFFGVFPWNVITYWFFRYLETERGYTSSEVLVVMVSAIAAMSLGYLVGGATGDRLFRRTPRGRILVSMVGVILGAIFLWLTLLTPLTARSQFQILMMISAFFIPLAAPNVISTVSDVTPPEVRSTALAVQSFIESGGAALAPLLAGFLALSSTLGNAILIICVGAWAICALFFGLATTFVTDDIQTLRHEMQRRALQAAPVASVAGD